MCSVTLPLLGTKRLNRLLAFASPGDTRVTAYSDPPKTGSLVTRDDGSGPHLEVGDGNNNDW